MADKIWPGEHDDSDADGFGEPDGLGGLWEDAEEDSDDVEVEFRPVSDEEFTELTHEEDEDPDSR